MLSYRNLETVRRNGLLAGQITHAGYESLSGALGVSFILAKILRGEFHAETVLEETRRFIGPGRFSGQLVFVQELLSGNIETQEGIRRLGTSGLVWESVPAAIYAFLRHPNDFRGSLEALSRAGGDTDTMAAIAGNISGALNGERVIPENLLRDLESSDSIGQKADRLFELIQTEKVNK